MRTKGGAMIRVRLFLSTGWDPYTLLDRDQGGSLVGQVG